MSNTIYTKKFHYVYLITELSTNKKYIGSRSCDNKPEFDLGHKYYSSSKNKIFIKNQKDNRDNYNYTILSMHQTREEAINEEIRLHDLYNVNHNPEFYNRSKQTSTGFDVGGKMIAVDKDGNIFHISVDDTRLKTGELQHYTTGKVAVKDKDGNTFLVNKDDERYLSGELVGHSAGSVVVRDKDGNTMQVSINDERYLSGELIHINKGRKLSADHKASISATSKGHKKSEETRARMSEAFKGRKYSAETKKKSSIAALNREKGTCIHCGKISDVSNLTRWHNDNCKLKKEP